MKIKEKIFKRINNRSFENSKSIYFTYCEVNDSFMRVPKGPFCNYHVWTKRGVIPDLISEGEEILVPVLTEEYLEENFDAIFEEIERMCSGKLGKFYLSLYRNHGYDGYGLVFLSRLRVSNSLTKKKDFSTKKQEGVSQ